METYFYYLEKVLGIRHLVWPESPVQSEATEAAVDDTARIFVLFVADQRWSFNAKVLFEKMQDAMKIPNGQYKVLFANEVSTAELQVSALAADHVVCFSKTLFDQLPSDHPAKSKTYSPEILLTRPELKKETWEDLKKVMKSLGVLNQ